MTRVHAGDGSLLAEYARERRLYMPIQAVPKMVVAAFLSRRGQELLQAPRRRSPRASPAPASTSQARQGPAAAGRVDHHPAGRQELPADQRADLRSQDQGDAPRAAHRARPTPRTRSSSCISTRSISGLGNYGVAAAALNYYGKSVHELTLAEAAYLAALPKAPNNYHPFRNREAAIERRNCVIDRMVENGYVTRERRREGQEGAARRQSAQRCRPTPRRRLLRRGGPPRTRRSLRREEALRGRPLGPHHARSQDAVDGAQGADRRARALRRGAWLARRDPADRHRRRDWGMALAEVPALGDVQPWRLAVVLDVATATGRDRPAAPPRASRRRSARERETGASLTDDGAKWTRKAVSRRSLSPGDVDLCRADRGPRPVSGCARCRRSPARIVAMDPYTGRVLAMVGGFSFDQSKFNRATQALRQPGSSFKPFVYADGARQRLHARPASCSTRRSRWTRAPGQEVWRPENYDGKFGGPAHAALRHRAVASNLMTVRLAQDVGMPLIAEYAKRFGVYDDLLPVLAMSLGAGETTVLRMTAAYSMFVNGGKRIKPTLIDRIQDRWGQTIYRHDERQCVGCDADKLEQPGRAALVDKREQVLDPLTAYQITSMLRGRRPARHRAARQGSRQAAGRQDRHDQRRQGRLVRRLLARPRGRRLSWATTSRARSAIGDRRPVRRADFPRLHEDGAGRQARHAVPRPPGIKLIRVGATGMRAGPGDGGHPGSVQARHGAARHLLGHRRRAAGLSPEADRAVGSGTGGL